VASRAEIHSDADALVGQPQAALNHASINGHPPLCSGLDGSRQIAI